MSNPRTRSVAILALSAALLAVPALPRAPIQETGADWPQWRGPSRDGTVGGGFDTWPGELERVWSVEVGLGHSSPVTAAGRAYQFSRQEGDEVLQALDVETGARLWQLRYPAPYRVHTGAEFHGRGPKSTPLVADGRVFVLGISGILSAVDSRDGALLWRHEFDDEFAATSPNFGTAMSPILYDDTLIAYVGGDNDGALAAFDVETGAEWWRWAADGPGYASPVLATFRESLQLITQTHRQIIGVDPGSGELLWSVGFQTDFDQNSVTALAIGESVILSGLNNGIFRARPEPGPDGWRLMQLWKTADASLYMSSPVLSNGRVFGFSHRRSGQFFALDPESGELIWSSRGREGGNAALLVVDDHVLFLTDEARLIVVDAGADTYAPVAEYSVADSPTWAHPAPVGDGLLIKDHETLTRWRIEPDSTHTDARPS